MQNTKQISAGLFSAVLVLSLSACGSTASAPTADDPPAFTPQLDAETSASLEVAGFLGNFEAFDQVVNRFNEYYPNITISYEQNSGNKLSEYLKSNSYIDIFMTNDDNLRYPDWEDYYVLDQCADLSDIDVHAVQEDLLPMCTFQGKLARLPIGQDLCGLAVNETLLEREGLSVPTNYQEFLSVLDALKQKGYTPIQGSSESAGACLIYNMGMDLIGSDPALLDELNQGSADAVEQIAAVYARLQTLVEKGYIDPAVNSTYPADNYDGAILNFLEGDVPFWMCTTEKFSGVKKRESKSESFKNAPFTYTFLNVPIGDDGAYAFVEPWFGFSVNQNSDAYEYAMEFLRFLATEESLNTLASVKGVPTAAKDSPADDRYTAVRSQEPLAMQYVNDGTLLNHMKEFFRTDANGLLQGKFSSAEEAAQDYVNRCAEVARSMEQNELSDEKS